MLQDQNALTKAQHTIEDSVEKIDKERGKVESFEASLVKEEKILEGIRDSLKGVLLRSLGFHRSDKNT